MISTATVVVAVEITNYKERWLELRKQAFKGYKFNGEGRGKVN